MQKRICDYFEEIAKHHGIKIKCQYNCNYATLQKKFFFYFDPYSFAKTDIPVIMLPSQSPHECIKNLPIDSYLRVMLIKNNMLPSDNMIDIIILLRILNLYNQFKELLNGSSELKKNWSDIYNDYFLKSQNALIPNELVAQEFFNIAFEAKALKWALKHTYSTYNYVMSLMSDEVK